MNLIIDIGMYSVALIGLGSWFRPKTKLADAFWFGTALLLLTLNIWHLAAPIGDPARLVVLIIGAGGWMWRWRVGGLPKVDRVTILLLGIAAPLLIYRTLNPSYVFDDGLYHFQTMMWYEAYPVVPGLANLHGRLGFNSSFYLFASLVGSAAMPILMGGLILLVATERVRFGYWLLIPLLWTGLLSFSNDEAAYLMGAATLILLWTRRMVSFILLAALVTIKLSSLPFAALTLLLLLFPLTRQKMAAVALAAVLFLPFIIHGAILSGYPLYPIATLPLPVDWRVTDARIGAESNWALSWARIPGAPLEQTLNGWDWLSIWVQNHREDVFVTFPLSLCVFGLMFIVFAHRGSILAWRRRLLVILLVALAAWFVIAPDPRFGTLVLWGTGTVMIELSTDNRRIFRFARWMLWGLGLSIALLNLVAGTLSNVRMSPEFTWSEFTTNSGLILYVPEIEGNCWTAPLPCTPYPNAALALRGQDSSEGFIMTNRESP